MRRFAVGVALLAAASACVVPETSVDPDVPLEISILPPSSGFGFWVNQPAYVAMFDITPGVGIRLLYPYVTTQLTQLVSAGSSFATSRFSFRPRTYFATRRLSEPHLILAVASRKPLNISHTVGFSEWITYKLGMGSVGGASLGVMNALFDQVIPAQPDGDWATALYVVYPDLDWRRNIWQLVRCADGQVYVVNVETDVFFCPKPDQTPGKPVDEDRGRRPERPSTARAGATIASAIQAGHLPIRRVGNDAVTRPPDPPSVRDHNRGSVSSAGRDYVNRTGGASSSSNENGRRPNPTPERSSEGSVPVVSRPVVLEPPTRPQGQEPRENPAPREQPTRDP